MYMYIYLACVSIRNIIMTLQVMIIISVEILQSRKLIYLLRNIQNIDRNLENVPDYKSLRFILMSFSPLVL